MSTNYFNTFIEVADDCPIDTAQVPAPKNGTPTVASLQFEMLADHPYEYTSDDVIFTVHARRNNIEDTPEARTAFFAKGQACLRASPLTKRYGWGVHSNADGRIAIVPLGSAEYSKHVKNGKLKHLKAMRTSRT